jgi:translation initiation factor 1
MSICAKCGLPQELCVCDEMTREGQRIKVLADKRRYGKYVTVVKGFDSVDTEKVAKELKSKFACGGTTKKDTIELQGNHVSKVGQVLIDMGFSEDMIDIA